MSESQKPYSGMERQFDIYKQGLLGKKPGQPISPDDLERVAQKEMDENAFGYVAGGAGGEDTVRENRAAFQRWRLVPRFLRNVAQRDLSVTIFGQRHPVPFLLAPIGVQSIIHKEAEVAVARAAKATGVGMILSTASSKPLEEVAAEARPTPHWYQLYWPNDLDMALSFVHRAEAAGYSAIVFTLDTFLLAWRERDLQNAYLPFLKGEGLGNYFSDPVFQSRLTVSPKVNPIAAIQHFSRVFSNPRLTWDDVAFLRKNTKLPVIVKGVLCTDDARRAVDHGANGIIVSNHGGRQVEGAIAALDALPGIVDAVGAQTTVLFDSGIRRGSDILKAMALGAKAVLLGRPYCYGLALNGADGVAEVIANLRADLDLSLGLIGCASLAELSREHLARSS